MNCTISHDEELLNDIDLYNQVIERQSKWPTLSIYTVKEFVVKRDEMIERLDEITRPSKKSFRERMAERRASFNSEPRSHTIKAIKIGYKFDGGEFIVCSCCLDIWRKLLRRLWVDFPDKREMMAASAKKFGYNRTYISRQRENLFLGGNDRRIKKYSRELYDGWYMDVNVTPERIHKIMPSVVSSAGLKWGVDVIVTWI